MANSTVAGRGQTGETSPDLITRFLRLFTDIRQGEAPKALLLALNVFLILLAYYILKAVREALILTGRDAQTKKLSRRRPSHIIHLRCQSLQPTCLPGSASSPDQLGDALLHLQPGALLFHGPGRGSHRDDGHHLLHLGRHLSIIWSSPNSGALPTTSTRMRRASAFSRLSPWGRRPAPHRVGDRQVAFPGIGQFLPDDARVRGDPRSLHCLNNRDSQKGGQEDRRAGGQGIGGSGSLKKAQEQPLKKGGGFQLVFKRRYLLYLALLISFTILSTPPENS